MWEWDNCKVNVCKAIGNFIKQYLSNLCGLLMEIPESTACMI